MAENKKNNNEILYIIIGLLVITIIGLVVYFLNQPKTINSDNNTKTENQTTQDTTKLDEKKEIKSVTVYDDARCGAQCGTSQIIAKLKTFPELANTDFVIKDYKKDEKVKDFLAKNNVSTLPLFVFSTNNINDELNKFMLQLPNKSYYLNIGAQFNPLAMDKLEKRPITLKTLDVFTMGFCPFGEIALKALPELQKTFAGDDIKINIHYIANKISEGKDANSFQSLHGVTEAEEDIRQICINKYYGVDKVIAYAQERYKNADNYGRISDKPEDALKALNLDVNKINKCVTNGEGAKLLAEDIKIAEELGISASPTWFANNRYKFGGIKAQNIQAQFCAYNQDLKGCKTQIQSDTTQTNGNNPSCGK